MKITYKFDSENDSTLTTHKSNESETTEQILLIRKQVLQENGKCNIFGNTSKFTVMVTKRTVHTMMLYMRHVHYKMPKSKVFTFHGTVEGSTCIVDNKESKRYTVM